MSSSLSAAELKTAFDKFFNEFRSKSLADQLILTQNPAQQIPSSSETIPRPDISANLRSHYPILNQIFPKIASSGDLELDELLPGLQKLYRQLLWRHELTLLVSDHQELLRQALITFGSWLNIDPMIKIVNGAPEFPRSEALTEQDQMNLLIKIIRCYLDASMYFLRHIHLEQYHYPAALQSIERSLRLKYSELLSMPRRMINVYLLQLSHDDAEYPLSDLLLPVTELFARLNLISNQTSAFDFVSNFPVPLESDDPIFNILANESIEGRFRARFESPLTSSSQMRTEQELFVLQTQKLFILAQYLQSDTETQPGSLRFLCRIHSRYDHSTRDYVFSQCSCLPFNTVGTLHVLSSWYFPMLFTPDSPTVFYITKNLNALPYNRVHAQIKVHGLELHLLDPKRFQLIHFLPRQPAKKIPLGNLQVHQKSQDCFEFSVVIPIQNGYSTVYLSLAQDIFVPFQDSFILQPLVDIPLQSVHLRSPVELLIVSMSLLLSIYASQIDLATPLITWSKSLAAQLDDFEKFLRCSDTAFIDQSQSAIAFLLAQLENPHVSDVAEYLYQTYVERSTPSSNPEFDQEAFEPSFRSIISELHICKLTTVSSSNDPDSRIVTNTRIRDALQDALRKTIPLCILLSIKLNTCTEPVIIPSHIRFHIPPRLLEELRLLCSTKQRKKAMKTLQLHFAALNSTLSPADCTALLEKIEQTPGSGPSSTTATTSRLQDDISILTSLAYRERLMAQVSDLTSGQFPILTDYEAEDLIIGSSKEIKSEWHHKLFRLVHGLRLLLKEYFVVSVIGQSRTGKSTFLRDHFGFPTLPGGVVELDQTPFPCVYQLSGLDRVLFIDFPGLDDADIPIEFRWMLRMSHAFAVVLKSENGISNHIRDDIFGLSRRLRIPTLVSVNQVFRHYSQFLIDEHLDPSPSLKALECTYESFDRLRGAINRSYAGPALEQLHTDPENRLKVWPTELKDYDPGISVDDFLADAPNHPRFVNLPQRISANPVKGGINVKAWIWRQLSLSQYCPWSLRYFLLARFNRPSQPEDDDFPANIDDLDN